jgi:Fe-Mn family superoxide dismutase
MDSNDLVATTEAFGVDAADVDSALVVDVRRAARFAADTRMVSGARWRDPAEVDRWAGELPRDHDVVVYCVHGHEVSRGVVLALRAKGVRARFLRGGIEAWQAQGMPMQEKTS